MRALMRGLAVLVTAAAALWAVPSAATAAVTTFVPCPYDELYPYAYATESACQVIPDDVQAVCTDDLSGANLHYTLFIMGVEGWDTNTVTITFADSSGKTVSASGQSSVGVTAWPASIKTTKATVTFTTETTPAYTASVDLTTPTCISQVLAEGGSPKSAVLASTGAQVGPLLAIAGGLLVVGLAIVAFTVRRRRDAMR
jgi:LPXTG-motif cell wall-anchored protein